MTITTVSPVSPARAAVAIRSENLCRHYRMGETLIRAVDGVSLEVRSGDFVALLGSSGSAQIAAPGGDKDPCSCYLVGGTILRRLSLPARPGLSFRFPLEATL